MITSVQNDKIKELVKLHTTKGRKEAMQFLVEGPHLVEEARACGVLREVYTTDDSIEGILVSDNVMRKICHTVTPVYILGVCDMFKETGIKGNVLALDRVQDPGNMGSLMRSAISFGFETIVIGEGCVDIYNDKVIRSSQGAIFKLNFLNKNLFEYLPTLQKYKIYGTNVKKGKSVLDIEMNKNIVLILGNEGSGVSAEIDSLGFDNLYIPLKNMESLNVSVAGGILMYELSKKSY